MSCTCYNFYFLNFLTVIIFDYEIKANAFIPFLLLMFSVGFIFSQEEKTITKLNLK